MSRISILLSLLTIGAACNWADKKPFCMFPELFPVSMKASDKQVDVQQYMGTWYEIATWPNRYQKDCICNDEIYEGNKDDGYFWMSGKCTKKSEEIHFSGKGKLYPRNDNNTRMRLYFSLMIPGNYYILDIDPDYQWAVLAEPCGDMAFVIGRTKTLGHDVLGGCFAVLQANGFDTTKMKMRDPSC